MPTPALTHWRENGRQPAGEGMAPDLRLANLRFEI